MKHNIVHVWRMIVALALVCAHTISTQQAALADAKEATSKLPLVFDHGDLQIALAGETKIEYQFARNIVLLNRSLPDEYGFFRHLLDLQFDAAWGQEKYDHKAVEFFVDVRQRMKWGAVGDYTPSSFEVVKVSNSQIGGHYHKNDKPVLWVRDLWIQASLCAIFDAETEGHQFVKAGLFPFWVGRGISLGAFYGASKSFLGLYSYINDLSAPGINVYGDILPGRLVYDLYYSRFEEKSSTLLDTFNTIKANQVIKANIPNPVVHPWRGVAKNNDLFAARLKWHALKNKDGHNLDLEPYVFYNEASDQHVETPADSKSELGAAGLAVEYNCGNFAFGGEAAFNFGHELLYAIDRNVTLPLRMGDLSGNPADSSLNEMFTHVAFTSGGALVPATNANSQEITIYSVPVNGATFGPASNPTKYTNVTSPILGTNRFRPEYRNNYRGWMAVVDAAYTVKSWDLKFAAAYGFASGDDNPHAVEVNKNYRGFVGINEAYAGLRVPSVLILEVRKLKRPLSINDNTSESVSDNSFTDMHYAGFGLTWFPVEHNVDRLSINSNMLFYWNARSVAKFDYTTDTFSTTEDASSFLGTEFNASVDYELIKDLYISGKTGIFFPGSFYSDEFGLTMVDQKFKALADPTVEDPEIETYGLGNSTAYYFKLGVSYSF